MIYYHDIGDYLSREEKLRILTDADGLKNIAWQIIEPNEKNDWLNQRGDVFDTLIPLGAKRDKDTETIFDVHSLGIVTNRDAWCYNFSKKKLTGNMTRMIEFYNEQAEEYKERKEWDKEITVDRFVNNDPKKISWTFNLKKDVERAKQHHIQKNLFLNVCIVLFARLVLILTALAMSVSIK